MDIDQLKGRVRSLMVGVIGSLSSMLLASMTQAQMIPDATLNTQTFGACDGSGGICGITSGTERGRNLFHSFQQFSLPNGDVAAFFTEPTIQNVIVRVTGIGQPFVSNINGAIATFDNTFNLAPRNFFLLNPNGIVFGPNARVLVGGSFLASTAERMLFQDGTILETRDQTVAPLLTVSVPTGLQMGQTPGPIQSKMQIGAVNSRYTDLALIGGDIILDNSSIYTGEQRLELSGLGANSTVGLQLNQDDLSLVPTPTAARRDIYLTNESILIAGTSQGGGSIGVTGRNLILDRDSLILAGILFGIDNAVTNQAGDIRVDLTESLAISQGSGIANLVGSDASGQGGHVQIRAKDILLRDRAEIQAATYGTGSTGDIQIITNTLTLDNSAIGILVADTGNGQGGNVTIQADSVALINGSSLSSNTAGLGNAGNVQITAQSMQLSGTAPDGIASGIASQVGPTGIGNSGSIMLQTDTLTVTDGGGIAASTFGRGNAGNVQIKADTIALDRTVPNGFGTNGINNQVGPTGIGQGGDVTIEANRLTLTNGAGISVNTLGQGDAGNIRIAASEITLDGVGPNGEGTPISSQVGQTGIGRGGNVSIQAESLTVKNSAAISAGTFGQGDAGDVQVTATTISLDGAASNGVGASGIGSQVGRTGIGQGGNVAVQTNSLSITNGGGISSSTFGRGDAGNVAVTAKTITIDGTTPNGQFVSGIGSQVAPTGFGSGGEVTIQTDFLTVTNKAVVSASALANGSAGNVNITAHTIQLDGGGIVASAVSGSGANITLNIRDSLVMRRGSQISTSAGLAGTGGDGGNITINIPKGFIIGLKFENSDITANAFTGSGGRVNITAQGIFGLQFRPKLTPFSDITASSEFGINGVVTLDLPNVDPSRGLVALPVNLTDTTQQIDRRCTSRQGRASSFVVTGRGGVPASPSDVLSDEAVVTNWVTVSGVSGAQPEPSTTTSDKLQPIGKAEVIVEAQGWVMEADGQVQLVVAGRGTSPAIAPLAVLECP